MLTQATQNDPNQMGLQNPNTSEVGVDPVLKVILGHTGNSKSAWSGGAHSGSGRWRVRSSKSASTKMKLSISSTTSCQKLTEDLGWELVV